MSDDLTLGRLLGRREAFNLVAARCSAAEAGQLREIRATKNYLDCGDWEEFCWKHLQMSRENANRIIRLLEELGPQYFELAQLTRISPQTSCMSASFSCFPVFQSNAIKHAPILAALHVPAYIRPSGPGRRRR